MAGLIESKYLPDFGATNLPPMKRSYCGFSFGSAVSGAGSYSHRSPKIELRNRRARRLTPLRISRSQRLALGCRAIHQ